MPGADLFGITIFLIYFPSSILQSGVIPEASIAVIAHQVLSAIEYLHTSACIIHRDIKGSLRA
jgi:serine/threonine protein kinase